MKKDYKKIILDLSRSAEERIQAAFKLENTPDDESLRALIGALKSDPSPIVRHECAFALGETASPKIAGPALMRAVKKDKSVFVRHEALLALGTLGDRRFAPFVNRYLKDKNLDIAESAQIALDRLKNS